MATLMEFKKKEIAKPIEVKNAVARYWYYDELKPADARLNNGNIIYTYTVGDGYRYMGFAAIKVQFNVSSEMLKYHDIYVDFSIKQSNAEKGDVKNVFFGIDIINGTIDEAHNQISWFTTDKTQRFYPNLSTVSRTWVFSDYETKYLKNEAIPCRACLTEDMVKKLIENDGNVWVYIIAGPYDTIKRDFAGIGSAYRDAGNYENFIVGRKAGDSFTIEISPFYTYPNYEGSLEEGSNVIYKNPSIIRDIKHNLPAIADDSEINRRIIATYPTMMYLYDTAGDMSELNTTVIQNCADENRETAQRLYETTMYEYNPIENYSMTEDGNHTLDGSSNTTNASTETSNYENCEGHKEKGNNRIDSSSEGSNNANGKSDSEATKQQFGYNSENPTDVEKSISKANTGNNSKTLTRDGSIGSSNNESRTHGKSETKSQTNGTENRINNESGMTHLTRKGNIGVTTTQQMIQQEREVILDVLDWYVAKFIKCFKWGAI